MPFTSGCSLRRQVSASCQKLTLRDQNPALESEITLEISGSLFAEWGYFSLFNIPFDKHEWFHLGPEIRDGKITARLFHYPESPFYDWQTNTPKKIGNETRTEHFRTGRTV